MNYRDLTVAVIDNGLFVELAIRLKQDFGTVLYYAPWESAFPKSRARMIGEGIAEITRLDSIWPMLDDIDLFVFPDVGFGDLQVWLSGHGKRVWGARATAEQFELDLAWRKDLIQSLGLPQGDYVRLKGTEVLRAFLRENDNVFVKISGMRGDMETWHSQNYDISEPRLDQLDHDLGARKKIIEFIVEAAIDDALEIGYDGYTVDGAFPSAALFGLEMKDKSYVGRVFNYADYPKPARRINRALSPLFGDWRFRGFWSDEIRVKKDGTAYLLDPCPRLGFPPGDLILLMIENLADVLWAGAEGIMVNAQWSGRWGVQANLVMERPDEHNYQPVQYPQAIAANIKLHNLTVIEGKRYFVPQVVEVKEIGAVVATGDTMEEAIASAQEIADQVEGYYVSIDTASLQDAEASVSKLSEYGISLPLD